MCICVSVSPAGLGFVVEAFIQLHLAQVMLDAVTARLAELPQILEAHTTTGEGDVLCRVVAESNSGIEELVQALLAVPGVVRTRTEISLSRRVPYRVLPLIKAARLRVDGDTL